MRRINNGIMKRKICSALILFLLLFSGGATFFATQLSAWYSNQLPGPQGHRHPQAVQCRPVGGWDNWDIKPACCYGAENCSRNDCNRSFSCDGTHFL